MFMFPVQLTTSRIGNLTRLIHTLLYVMTIHTYCGAPGPRLEPAFFNTVLILLSCHFKPGDEPIEKPSREAALVS